MIRINKYQQEVSRPGERRDDKIEAIEKDGCKSDECNAIRGVWKAWTNRGQ